MLSDVSQPLPYTSSPVLLAIQDILLFIRITFVWPPTAGIPSIVLPILPYRAGRLDELYPSYQNLKAIFLHIILIITQSTFLLLLIPSFFFGFPIPLLAFTPTFLTITTLFILGNNYFCILLNGTKRHFNSITDPSWPPTSSEKWIFINGVAVGNHWMQSNLDLLALVFRRPIHGIHNKTSGIIFDVIETIIQRTFGYATPDVRAVFADVQRFIQEEERGASSFKKIVLILHSQGAVEGGLVMDWLFATVDRGLLERLEVYTFGNAANHFCDPPVRVAEEERPYSTERRVVKYIEHYANLGDYVSKFGILHFRPLPGMKRWGGGGRSRSKEAEWLGPKHTTTQRFENGAGGEKTVTTTTRQEIENTYIGRLFVRKGSGHQLNGNYLDNFFRMNEALTEVLEENEFMDSELNESVFEGYDIASRASERDVWEGSSRVGSGGGNGDRKIREVCRLWKYRNGMSPED